MQMSKYNLISQKQLLSKVRTQIETTVCYSTNEILIRDDELVERARTTESWRDLRKYCNKVDI